MKTIALSVTNKIDNKLKFLYRKNWFLTATLRQLLCNALIQLISTTLVQLGVIQTSQNICRHFCLQLDKTKYIS